MDILVKFSREENIKHYGAKEVKLDLEEYLRGVVPSEIGNAPIEACAAQAVAARTYAISKINSKGYITDNSSTDQAFRSSRLTGYSNAYEGIKRSAGYVLKYNNKLISAVYSSSNGGRTRSAEERWGGTGHPYLAAKDDPYDNGDGKGHRVGMSQVGAKNRANAGHDFKEILEFYYTGAKLVNIEPEALGEVNIMCSSKEERDKLLQHLKSCEVVKDEQ